MTQAIYLYLQFMKPKDVGKAYLRNRRSVICIISCGKVTFNILIKDKMNVLLQITYFYNCISFFW